METIVSLIANTTTSTGLRIRSAADKRRYAALRISDE
jgi:hypothetical protein